MDVYQKSLDLHKKYRGKLGTTPLVNVTNKEELAIYYTPGVAEPSRAIAKDPALSYDLTLRGRTIAVISDGSAVLGLGDIGAEAAMPVMEGKALLLKEFGGVDAFPLVINAKQAPEIIQFVRQVAPTFAGILLEDITAPKCFMVEEQLQNLGIPVFHDDQHGTAIIVKAALMNAAKAVNKDFSGLNVVIVGAGAAGLAVARMLLGLNCSEDRCDRLPGSTSVGDVIVVDSKGALYSGRDGQNIYKQAVSGLSNKHRKSGSLADVIQGADAVIGVSGPDTISKEMVGSMNEKAIVFAMANPIPEIMPDIAKAAGAAVIATGRSDFPNQINNVLAFPGIFRAVIKGRLTTITHQMKEAAVQTLAAEVPNPTPDHIVPDLFHPDLAEKISEAILKAK